MPTNTIDSTKKFSKILVAIDGSEPSMDAADYAILMARIYNSSMTALHVLPEKIRYEYQDKIDFDVPSDASTNRFTKKNCRNAKARNRRKLFYKD